ncbi:ATP synthase subunit I [Shouchella shacheensis]|uniref:ATP synthase subunit I n=1 Tax=Shouchella shacheensis TaxID=1649580 RepID=UPI00074044C6|nr:ATP synthase subunit I [Shouchella shacheensis]
MSNTGDAHLLHKQLRHYILLTVLAVLLLLIGYVVTPYSAFFLGLILGLFTSLLNLWTTYRNAHIIGGTHSSSKWLSMILVSFGFIFRISMALVAIWFALEYPELFHVLAVVIGLGLMYVIMMLDMLVKALRRKR